MKSYSYPLIIIWAYGSTFENSLFCSFSTIVLSTLILLTWCGDGTDKKLTKITSDRRRHFVIFFQKSCTVSPVQKNHITQKPTVHCSEVKTASGHCFLPK